MKIHRKASTRCIALCLAVLTLAVGNLNAQDRGSKSTGKRYTIYSNLGPKNDAYYVASGWGIAPGYGPTGIAFTPKNDADVTEIVVGVTTSQGSSDTATVTLNEDSGGLPGSVLYSVGISNLPAFGSCCTLQVLKLTSKVKVTKGTPYWVVVTAGANSNLVWNWAYDIALGPGAFYNSNRGVWYGQNDAVSALGVFGTRTK